MARLSLGGFLGLVVALGVSSAVGVVRGRSLGYDEAMNDLRVHSAYSIDFEENKSGLVIEHKKREPTVLVRQSDGTYRFNKELDERYKEEERK